jgi:voltage-gated potassium channel
MLLGVGTVAVPAALLAGKFSQELELRRTDFERLAEGAAADGRIDTYEKQRLIAEGRDAGLNEEDARAMLARAVRQRRQPRACPHCGKALEG